MLRHVLLPRDGIRVGQDINRHVTSITSLGLLHLRRAVKLKEIVLTETHCGHLVRNDVLDAWLTELPDLRQVEINISRKAMPVRIGRREVDWYQEAEKFVCATWNRDGEEDKEKRVTFLSKYFSGRNHKSKGVYLDMKKMRKEYLARYMKIS